MNAQDTTTIERAISSVLDMFAEGIARDGAELFTAKVNAYIAQGR